MDIEEPVTVKLDNGGLNVISINSISTTINSKRIKEISIWHESDPVRVKAIMQQVSLCNSITSLAFKGSDLQDEGVVSIARELAHPYRAVSSIYVEGNYGNTGGRALCETLAKQSTITNLVLLAPFSDEGIEAVLSLVLTPVQNFTHVDISKACITELTTWKKIFRTFYLNTSVSFFGFPKSNHRDPIPQEWIEGCFSMNTTLLASNLLTPNHPIQHYINLNKMCNKHQVGKKQRDLIPQQLSPQDILDFFGNNKTRAIFLQGEYNSQEKEKQEAQAKLEAVQLENKEKLDNKQLEFAQLFAKYKATYKKKLGEQLLITANERIEQRKLLEAKVHVQFAIELGIDEAQATEGCAMLATIQDRVKEVEEEKQVEIDARVTASRNEVLKIEQIKARPQEERMQKEKEMWQQKEAILQEQIEKHKLLMQVLQEQDVQLQKLEEPVANQQREVEDVLLELATNPGGDVNAIRQKINSVDPHTRMLEVHNAVRGARKQMKADEPRIAERVDWMQKQLELHQARGIAPSQRSFLSFLKKVKRLSDIRHKLEGTPFPLKCFISYAWETTPAENKALQDRLQRLKNELEVAGMEVLLDIRNMKGSMNKFMLDGIKDAHKVLLICTPRLKVRAGEQNPTKNNLQLEFEASLDKANTTDPEFIVPLIYSGSFRDALPPQVSHLLSIDLSSPANYYTAMASLAPMGLIPMLLGFERNKDFKHIHDRLFAELEEYSKILAP